MQYTTLGKTGLEVSRLGFGCMRLPMKTAQIVDRELAIPMLHKAVELGITYFDTAVGYCGGDSQRVLGEAMEGMRDKVVLSTKNHHYDKKDKKGWWKNLDDSIERLRTDHIDIYNYHGMNYEQFTANVDGEDGMYKEMLKAKEQGMVRHICHSFHGDAESLMKCVDTGLFDVVTLQYNIIDKKLEEGIEYANKHGMGVVVMGPVGGGRLGYPSGTAHEIAGEVKSTPELALRFVLSNESVNVALSGMSTMQQLEENVETVSGTAELSAQDHSRIEEAVEERRKLAGLYCTGCNYCMPCPDGVDIPDNFEVLNLDRVFGLNEHAKSRYKAIGGQAALCTQCGKCVKLCPQELDIPTRLGEAVALLDELSGSVSGWSELHNAAHDESGMLKLKMRYFVKNYSDKKYDKVEVKLHGHMEEQVSPDTFTLDNLKPFGKRHKDLELRVMPPIAALSIDSLITFNGSHTFEHLYHIVASANKVSDYKISTEKPAGAVIHVPGPMHPVHTSTQTLRSHSFDFSASYDEHNLYIWADVEEDLLFPIEDIDAKSKKGDQLKIFLDGREEPYRGIGGITDGVMNVTIFAPAKGNTKPGIVSSSDADVNVQFIHTPAGYGISCAVPWSAFNQSKGIPSVIGFDIAQLSHDGEGKQTLRLSWTGRERQEGDTASFGRLFLT